MKNVLPFFLLGALWACSPGNETPAIADQRGQWVFINYWAEWCKPCIKEVPELNQLDRERADITVLGVNYDGAEGEALAAQIDKLGITFATLPEDPAPGLQIPRPSVLPTTLVLDPEGRLRETLVGPQTGEELAAVVTRLAAASQ